MLHTQLRSFHAVAEAGGFSAAARALRIGQPTITTQVKELEEFYGIELFLRSGRRVCLTGAGHALFEQTRRLFSLEKEIHDLLEAHGGLQGGEFRLAAVGPFHATEMIGAFHRLYPSVKLEVLLGNSRQTLQRLLEFEADAAILAHFENDPRVEQRPYSRHEVVVFVHRGHPWFERKTIRFSDLEGQKFVLREQGSTTRLAFEKALHKAGMEIDVVMEIGSREAVWKAVECGIGIGVVADFEFVAHPDLRVVRFRDAKIETQYHIAFLKDREESPSIKAFLEVIYESNSAAGKGSRQGPSTSDRRAAG